MIVLLSPDDEGLLYIARSLGRQYNEDVVTFRNGVLEKLYVADPTREKKPDEQERKSEPRKIRVTFFGHTDREKSKEGSYTLTFGKQKLSPEQLIKQFQISVPLDNVYCVDIIGCEIGLSKDNALREKTYAWKVAELIQRNYPEIEVKAFSSNITDKPLHVMRVGNNLYQDLSHIHGMDKENYEKYSKAMEKGLRETAAQYLEDLHYEIKALNINMNKTFIAKTKEDQEEQLSQCKRNITAIHQILTRVKMNLRDEMQKMSDVLDQIARCIIISSGPNPQIPEHLIMDFQDQQLRLYDKATDAKTAYTLAPIVEYEVDNYYCDIYSESLSSYHPLRKFLDSNPNFLVNVKTRNIFDQLNDNQLRAWIDVNNQMYRLHWLEPPPADKDQQMKKLEALRSDIESNPKKMYQPQKEMTRSLQTKMGDEVKLTSRYVKAIWLGLKTEQEQMEKQGVNLSKALIFALNGKNLKVVKSLLRRGVNLDVQSSNHFSPFGIAIFTNQPDVAEELKRTGIDVKAELKRTVPPHNYSVVERCILESEPSVLSLIVRYGGLQMLSSVSTLGYTPASLAAYFGKSAMLYELNQFKVDMNQPPNFLPAIALIDGARNNVIKKEDIGRCVQALAKAKADFTLQNSLGSSPLRHALQHQRWDIVMFMLLEMPVTKSIPQTDLTLINQHIDSIAREFKNYLSRLDHFYQTLHFNNVSENKNKLGSLFHSGYNPAMFAGKSSPEENLKKLGEELKLGMSSSIQNRDSSTPTQGSSM